MEPGDTLAGRFKLERRARAGGMGEVFQAWDREADEAVAVKVMLQDNALDRGRFMTEAEVLSELSHPGIVQHIAHGVTPAGKLYLVMEWLEGEDLATRLRRGPLRVSDAITLGRRVAEALSVAHAGGVIHRDLKPSNLFLVENEVDQVTLVDFGLARWVDGVPMTKTGMVVGTPGYMAPEQVRSGGDIDGRVDLFALGCVLFEALTGRVAFSGEQLLAMVAKILFEAPPCPGSLRADVPEALDALIMRMLAKDRGDRPRDATAVADALAALGAASAPPSPSPPPPPLGPPEAVLTVGERRIVSIVMLGPPADREEPAARAEKAREPAAFEGALRRTVEAHGGAMELCADGAVVVTWADLSSIPTDQAAQAARASLALCALWPDRPIALATGRAEVSGKLPVGEVIDRAAGMVAELAALPGGPAEGGGARPVAIDEVTVGLLDARFEVREGSRVSSLHGEREVPVGARTLLGKPTLCVGRDWELGTLEKFWADCVEDSAGRAVLVTAPAGMGKSRLAHEFLERIRKRDEEAQIWLGRINALEAGSTFGLLACALRGALGLEESEPPEARRQKIVSRVSRLFGPDDRAKVAEFLGELMGVPFPDDESVPLRAARQDGELMGDQMGSAFRDFLRAEAAACPVLLVLDDLHWGDLSTVRFIEDALRDVRGAPFLVLALARPEVHTLFPKLWPERLMQEIRLRELGRKASARLAQQVLGERADPATIERIVKQAEGHAFYLEELIRAVAEGRGAALPETVLAMVEARLSGLSRKERRALRAASVFGEVFWRGGVAELVGSPTRRKKVASLLLSLVAREVLVKREGSRFWGEPEFAFRHSLLREGAYAMLTEEDRVLGHRLAGAWLSEREERDAMVLAEHFERGRDPARAAAAYLRAAEQAYRGGDLEAVITRARRGLSFGPASELQVQLLGLLCEAHVWRNEMSAIAADVEELLRLAPPGSAPFARAVQAKVIMAASAGDRGEFMAAVERVQRIEPDPGAEVSGVFTIATAIFYLDLRMEFELATLILERLHAIVEPVAEHEPVARAWMSMNHAHREAWVNEDPWSGVLWSEVARASFKEADNQRGVRFAQLFLGMNLWFLGAHARGELELVSVTRAEASFGTVSGNLFLTLLLTDSGALEEARRLADQMVEAGKARGDPMDEGRGRWAKAEILLRRGDLALAEEEALAAAELLSILPLDSLAAMATVAAVELARGRAEAALITAEDVMARYASTGTFGYKGAYARLVHAEALFAVGDEARAAEAIAVARERLFENAAKIGDASYRRSFLEGVPENARTLALARAWLGEEAPPSRASIE